MRSVLMVALLGFSCVFVACGKDSDSKAYSYDFEQNGCKTGRHSFSTVAAMCDALQDEDLNRGCALNLRIDYFEQSCGNRDFQFEGNDGGIGRGPRHGGKRPHHGHR